MARATDEPEAPAPAQGHRVAVFGGSFNPPHVAHVLAAVYVLSTEPMDEVLVVPVYRHPFAKELAPFEDRLAMCKLAFEWIPRVRVSTVERELGGESLTLRTLEHLASKHPGWSMRLLLGGDVIADLSKWHRFDRIAEIAPPLFVGRAGVTTEGAPEPMLPKISSTEVRDAIGRGESERVEKLVPREVLAYAAERGLYRRS
ncbi:nicotinate (nicotinamide) nucleotide adenylyltransferase [Polyangium sp. 6x1]|uniref:nicotinate (nicotinamide) nucleotide adenylyltransferase n=1 Tax=Polyangium sp. 6x1 TaxID=3042689 RepID=UPI0024828EEF|nr:nicotinate (nicotinamide) nucleotide adenylyltransferase [Polyangium sp. 6x1]MDI1449462.1 nicotinate (nicotinamide) nucleotide adenylyltransferase [Polyangium sp. 6x1]